MHNKFASTLLKTLKEKEPIPFPTMICDYNNYIYGSSRLIRPVLVVLLNDYSPNLEMVGKSILEAHGYHYSEYVDHNSYKLSGFLYRLS